MLYTHRVCYWAPRGASVFALEPCAEPDLAWAARTPAEPSRAQLDLPTLLSSFLGLQHDTVGPYRTWDGVDRRPLTRGPALWCTYFDTGGPPQGPCLSSSDLFTLRETARWSAGQLVSSVISVGHQPAVTGYDWPIGQCRWETVNRKQPLSSTCNSSGLSVRDSLTRWQREGLLIAFHVL